jgi:hypothetical protein
MHPPDVLAPVPPSAEPQLERLQPRPYCSFADACEGEFAGFIE